jgi:hypothetical protein
LARAAPAGVGARRRCRRGGHGARRRARRSGAGGALRLRAAMPRTGRSAWAPLCGVGPAADRADATRDQATTTAARPGRLGLHHRPPAGRPTSARQRTPARRSARALSAAAAADALPATRLPAPPGYPQPLGWYYPPPQPYVQPLGYYYSAAAAAAARAAAAEATFPPRAPQSRHALVPGR